MYSYPTTAEYSHFVRTHIDGLCIPAQYEWNTNSDSPWSYQGLKKLPQFCFLDFFQLSRQRACSGIFTQHCFIVPFILCCISVLFILSIICPHRSIAYRDGQNKKVTCIKKLKKYTYIPFLEVQVQEVEGKEKFNRSCQLSL